MEESATEAMVGESRPQASSLDIGPAFPIAAIRRGAAMPFEVADASPPQASTKRISPTANRADISARIWAERLA